MAIISNKNYPFNSTNFNNWVSSQASYQAGQYQQLVTTVHSDSWTTAVNYYYPGQTGVHDYYDHSRHSYGDYSDSGGGSTTYSDYGNWNPSYYDHSENGYNASPSHQQYQPSGYSASSGSPGMYSAGYSGQHLSHPKVRLAKISDAKLTHSDNAGIVKIDENNTNDTNLPKPTGLAHVNNVMDLGILSGGYTDIPAIPPSYTQIPAVHTNYAFDHSNYIPSAPALFQIVDNDRLKDSVTIGYYSYDRDGGTVYYNMTCQMIQTLSGASSVGPVNQLVNGTTSNTLTINTANYPDGIYQFQIVAYNPARSENNFTQNYISGTKTFTVRIWQNQVPVILNISGTTLISTDITTNWPNNVPINFNYKAYDQNGDTIKYTQYLDSTQLATGSVSSGTTINYAVSAAAWTSLSVGSHTIKIVLSDGIDEDVIFTKTILKLDDRIQVVTKASQTPSLAKKLNLCVLDKRAIGDTIQIWACNNGFDLNPVWEDVTTNYVNRAEYTFTNTKQTATKAGISIKILLKKSFAS